MSCSPTKAKPLDVQEFNKQIAGKTSEELESLLEENNTELDKLKSELLELNANASDLLTSLNNAKKGERKHFAIDVQIVKLSISRKEAKMTSLLDEIQILETKLKNVKNNEAAEEM